MSTDTPEQVLASIVEGINAGNLEALMTLYEPDAGFASQPGTLAPGLTGVRQSLAAFIGMKGTLDLLVLKTLATLGPQHGFGIARRLEQVAEGAIALNQGTIYPALLRLDQKGWITSSWGTSENNRRARFYTITKRGVKQLAEEEENWARTVAMMKRLLEPGS